MSAALLRGLPDRLPEGESLLWQGAPAWTSLAFRAFHLRKLAAYFAVLIVWLVVAAAWEQRSLFEAAGSLAIVVPLAIAALAILAFFAWLTCRTAIYTITNRRVVMRIGMALPMYVNIPFAIVEAADARPHADGTGDISLSLKADGRLAYLVLWPHARPWRISAPQPTMRAVPDAAAVASTLARALAASAGQPVQPSLDRGPRRARAGLPDRTGVAAAT